MRAQLFHEYGSKKPSGRWKQRSPELVPVPLQLASCVPTGPEL
jgi:hypothetical protein